jgi:uncharacterized protein (TIGR02266 family)
MAEGNRKDPRARVLNMTVRYKSATVDEFIENHSHDISKGGIFIKTRAPFPAGTLLKFEVRIAEDQRLMQGVGRVVWRREPERAEEGFPAGMGIKFIKIGEGSAELIAQIISAREGEESSFDAGVRETGLQADGARSEGGARHSAPPAAAVESSQPPGDAPSLQVESGPLSMPVDGEFRVSSPPKKRQGQVSETRKVVLQGAAFGAPSADKTPVSTPARIVAAQALDERAPSREAPPAKERSSIVDETTAPRARSSGDPHSDRSKEERQSSNPSVLGLVAILGAIGLTDFLDNRIRGPEAAAPEASTVTAAAPPVAEPPRPLTAAPATLPAPPPETGEGAPPGDVGATATAPSTSLDTAPSAALGAAGAAGSGTAPGTPSAAMPPPGTTPAVTGAKPAAAPVAVVKPVAPTPPPVAPKPKPPVVAAAKPPAPAKPKPDATPTEKPAGEASIRPAGEPEPTAPAPPASSAGAKPAEPKKTPPAAATPPAAEPAPAPPSDDNPY